MANLKAEITALAERYKSNLSQRMSARTEEMETDGNQHYLIYRALGVSASEGKKIDLFQNKGRFLYKSAGGFMEEAVILCLQNKYQSAKTIRVENTSGTQPKTFEIDCLVNDRDAFEIKWRDATTDGDHINKEHTRLKVIANHGYNPIRMMFFSPMRDQSIKIQRKLHSIYENEGGKFYEAQDAWKFLEEYTEVDLYSIIKSIGTKNFQ